MRNSGKVLAISDVMSMVGVGEDTFQVDGWRVTRKNVRLTLDDGTLAGSDLTMIGAVWCLRDLVGVPTPEALRMASLHPVRFLGDPSRGRLVSGEQADLVWVDGDDRPGDLWVGGVPSTAREGSAD